jgi:hypothetical protein
VVVGDPLSGLSFSISLTFKIHFVAVNTVFCHSVSQLRLPSNKPLPDEIMVLTSPCGKGFLLTKWLVRLVEPHIVIRYNMDVSISDYSDPYKIQRNGYGLPSISHMNPQLSNSAKHVQISILVRVPHLPDIPFRGFAVNGLANKISPRGFQFNTDVVHHDYR